MTALEKLSLGLIASGGTFNSSMGLRYTLENGLGMIMPGHLLSNLEAEGMVMLDKESGSQIVTTKGRQTVRSMDLNALKEDLAPEVRSSVILAKMIDGIKDKVQQ